MHIAIPIIMTICGAVGGTYVAHDAGYIPITQIMDTKEPVGYQPVCSSCIEENYRDIISEIPNLNKIKYNVYISTSNHLEIVQDYNDRLKDEGYQLETSGEKNFRNITIYYYGFIKGITAVGIAIVKGSQLGFPEAESFILYSTGNVMDYQAIINWYNTNGLSGTI